MSRCDLFVRIEGDRHRTYHPGDRVTGEVRVKVDREVERQTLRATLGWRTHGRGNRHEESVHELVLHEGRWGSGESPRYAFEFTLPKDGPFTYHGRYLNVDWYVEARSDIPWARDPRAREDLLVAPPEGVVPRLRDRDLPPEHRDGLAHHPALAAGIAGIFLLVAGGLALASAVTDFPALSVAFPLVAAGLVGFAPLRRFVASRHTGEVEIEVGGVEGSEIPCRVWLDTKDPGRLGGVHARLQLHEIVTSGSGTNRSTHKHQAYECPASLQPAGRDARGHRYEGRVSLPDPAPCSFAAPDNRLRWQLEVQVEVEGWPDWKKGHPLLLETGAEVD